MKVKDHAKQAALFRSSYPIILVLTGLLLTQNVLEAVFLHMSREGGKATYIMTTAIIATELIKIKISIIVLLVKGSSISDIIGHIRQTNRVDNWLPLTVPSVIYSVQNNLRIVALSYLHPSTYQLLLQGKIISTAFFTTRILGRKLHRIQWISLIILTAGLLLCQTGNHQNSDTNSNSQDTHMMGLICVLGITLCSGLASVYTEKIIKRRKQQSIYMLNIQMSLLGLITNCIYLIYSHGPRIILNPVEFFKGYTTHAWVAVYLGAVGGILVGLVVQYTSSLAKTYVVSFGLLANTMIDSYIFKTSHTSFAFGIATVIIFCSVLLFNDPATRIDEDTQFGISKPKVSPRSSLEVPNTTGPIQLSITKTEEFKE